LLFHRPFAPTLHPAEVRLVLREIHQQAELETRRGQIRPYLSVMRPAQRLNGLQLDDERVLHHNVQPVTAHDFAAVSYRHFALHISPQTLVAQLDAEGAVINALEEAGAEGLVDG
jgi:hypothetical protein